MLTHAGHYFGEQIVNIFRTGVWSSSEVRKSCTKRVDLEQIQQLECLLSNIGSNAAENEPSKVCYKRFPRWQRLDSVFTAQDFSRRQHAALSSKPGSRYIMSNTFWLFWRRLRSKPDCDVLFGQARTSRGSSSISTAVTVLVFHFQTLQ